MLAAKLGLAAKMPRVVASRNVPICTRRMLSSANEPDLSMWVRFWHWTTQHRPNWRESKKEAAIVFVVFGITGSTSVTVVRPALKATTGIEGSLIKGPWSYRILSILAVSPIYAAMLVTYGTLAGRHRYFASMSYKIFGRFLPTFALNRISSAFSWCVPSLKGVR